jgi:CheY-like chemotaxis protein
MSGQEAGGSPTVLIVSRHEEFVRSAVAQLARENRSATTMTAEEAEDVQQLRNIAPAITFVDYDALSANQLPLFQLIHRAFPDSALILIANLAQVEEAAKLAHSRGVFDYVVTEFADDPHRIPFLVERATTDNRSRMAESRGNAKLQYERVIEEISVLRNVLKDKHASPVVELLHRYPMNEIPSAFQASSPEEFAAEAYRNSLIDLVCGRLKRLEGLIQVTGPDKEQVDGAAAPDPILVVDDGPVDAELAKFLLEKHGYDVLVADSAASAKLLLDSNQLALVLMDIHLGDANGLRLVASMRENERSCKVPVIVVSSDTRKESVSAARSLSVQGFVRKPFDPTVLVDKVKSVIAESLSSS